MQQKYQEAITICQRHVNPHLFITFTANAKWPKIEDILQHSKYEKFEDKPDIVVRY